MIDPTIAPIVGLKIIIETMVIITVYKGLRPILFPKSKGMSNWSIKNVIINIKIRIKAKLEFEFA